MATILINNTPQFINTVYCIGRSYREHIAELNNPIPDEPLVFLKPNSSIVTGNTLTLPEFSNTIRDNKTIDGVTIGLDLTARDVQEVCKQKGLPWLKAKGFKNACWLGELKPFDASKPYELFLQVNDDIRQHDTTDKMMYSFEYLIDYLDTLYGLQQGDIIMTGTPKGVGRLQKGDCLYLKLNEYQYSITVK
ncbi:MAG: fumarylacetoacetate hydrolase family protein [Moraxella sp.]|nr:fumarylacetoacetate hydrolase family protein [Moraxella sp.]